MTAKCITGKQAGRVLESVHTTQALGVDESHLRCPQLLTVERGHIWVSANLISSLS